MSGTADTDIADVVIAGGGVIGTAIAWRAAAAGLAVSLVDPGRGDAASLVAAGMLAPVSESLFGEERLLRLNLLAVRRFPGFAAELEEASGRKTGLRREGTLTVAYDPDDYAALARLTEFRRSCGLDAEDLDGRACRGLEPFLAPEVRGGFLFGGDWSVDNRRYAAALRQAATAAGVRAVRGEMTGVLNGKVTLADGTALAAGAVVVAAGCWSGGIEGLPDGLAAAVRPVKGQLLRLRVPGGMPGVLRHTIRATVRGRDLYLVPRDDGEVVVGATQEERGRDVTVTAGAVHDLLHDAMSVLPVTAELILAETCAGLRPGTPDNGPLVGPLLPGDAGRPAGTGLAGGAGHSGGAGLPGDTGQPSGTELPGGAGPIIVATGHFRNGILLSPVTADAVVAHLTGGRPAPEWVPFSPQRFAGQRFAGQGFGGQRSGGQQSGDQQSGRQQSREQR